MYSITEENYGYKITFLGQMEEYDLNNWISESKSVLETSPSTFGVLIDMRALSPLTQKNSKIMESGQRLFHESGLERSAVILNSTLLTMQFKKIARDSGIRDTEKYFNATENENWEEEALNWIVNGICPY